MRTRAAQCLEVLAVRFSQPQLDLPSRLSAVCMAALLDRCKPLTTHYGAIKGIAALGPRAGLLLLLPKLSAVYAHLVPVLQQVRSRDCSSASNQ